MKDKIYILNPQYHLRNDTRRILLFSKSSVDERSSANWYAFLHPLQAVLLSFFTYRRTLDENLSELGKYFHCEQSKIERYITPFLENSEPLCSYWHDQKIVFPKNMLVAATNKDNYLELCPEEFVCNDLDLSTRRLYYAPLSVTFMLTNRCVTHCCYCYADTSTRLKKSLSTQRIMNLIEEASNLQLKHVNLIGGEIFLHPDWKQILKKTVDCHVEPEYISTKMPLTDELVNSLSATGYKGIIQISLDTVNPDKLKDSLHVSDDYITSLLHGIRILDESGIPYLIATVLTTYNTDIETLLELYRFLSTLKHLTGWNLVPVNNSIQIGNRKFAKLKPSRQQIEEVFKEFENVTTLNAAFPIRLIKDLLDQQYYMTEGGSSNFAGTKCSALNTHFFILPDGKVTICEQLYWDSRFLIGDVTKQGLQEVWTSSRSLHLYNSAWKDIRPSSNCFDCTLQQNCFKNNNRCWVNIIKAYGKDNWDYPDPRCNKACKMKNNIGY